MRASDPAVIAAVSEMLLDVERRGLDAVRDHSRRLDGWDPPSFEVSPALVASSAASLPSTFQDAFHRSAAAVRAFAQHQRALLVDTEMTTRPGVVVGHRHVAIESVGSYMPGGRYPLVSSPLMSVIVPKVAGVESVIACTPPQPGGGGPTPAMVWVASQCGADRLFCLGGVPALAAMAFGIGEFEAVDMLCGAGNAYVAEAKRQLYGRVGIDLLAGPSEVAVICDDTANPAVVAADLLGQAEHGPNSPAYLIAIGADVAAAVIREIEALLPHLANAAVAGAAWNDFGMVLVATTNEQAAEMSDWIACEHLEVHTSDDQWFLDRLRNYGSIFLGNDTTVTYSDKGCTGTNHTLPTQGAARYTGGLGVAKFLKTLTWQRVTDPRQARQVAADAAAFGPVDGLQAHAYTAELRLAALEPQ